MHVQVDQSGTKIERTHRETVLAFSDDVEGAVVIPAKVKKECVAALRKESWKAQVFVLQVFVAGIFLLLQDYLARIDSITVDQEYPGRDGDIKGMLLNLIRQVQGDFPKENLIFEEIGRHSRAHHKAYGVYKGFQKPDKVLTTEEILTVLRK